MPPAMLGPGRVLSEAKAEVSLTGIVVHASPTCPHPWRWVETVLGFYRVEGLSLTKGDQFLVFGTSSLLFLYINSFYLLLIKIPVRSNPVRSSWGTIAGST